MDKGGVCGVWQASCATIDYPGSTATWSAMFAHFTRSVNSCPCENTTVDLLPTVCV